MFGVKTDLEVVLLLTTRWHCLVLWRVDELIRLYVVQKYTFTRDLQPAG